ncbi:hypothetical protein HD806DRAFT_549729 [Xylariaceae sp. AK1471]|nr:hypothetical protein HD806DRAFT_549729 [Xylariaceae sp. AK1471]
MPRNRALTRLQADIADANNEAIPNIQRISKGDDQDEFVIIFSHPGLPLGEIEIRIMPQDTAGYPRDNFYLVYTNDEIPPKVGKILEDAMTSTAGMLIVDMLRVLSHRLCTSLDPTERDEDNDSIMTDVDVDFDQSEDSGNSDIDVPFEYGDDDDFGLVDRAEATAYTNIPDVVLQRIRQDLRTVRNAGFRVGKICGVDQASEYSIVATSVKVSKLGISSETRTAWNLESSAYVVLLMKYTGGYASFEDVLSRPVGQTHLEFRLRKCSKYRPTLSQAIAVFQPTLPKRQAREDAQKPEDHRNPVPADRELSTFGVGGSIDLLLNNDFLTMTKLRKMTGVSWDDAKKLQSQLAVANGWDNGSLKMPTLDVDPSITDVNLPPILMGDPLLSKDPVSLPLIATQFALRYLVKCAEYCMICHEKVAGNFEALKPYVCGKPLCLFQYMNLGLGPSIDHEIINQEYVVDLLISFCYASLHHTPGFKPKLREFPLGLNLQVPHVRNLASNRRVSEGYAIENYGVLIDPIEVQVFWTECRAKITDNCHEYHPDLIVGQWVVIYTKQSTDEPSSPISGLDIFHHARIEEITGSDLWLHVASRHPVPMRINTYGIVRDWDWDTGVTTGKLVFCNQSLDDIETDEEKAFSITLLLSALPTVGEMRSYLMGNLSRELASWDRIPPAAMKLLRWIIASNRSFIVQLDKPSSQDENSSSAEDENSDRSREKISGVDGWIQFRFAQGSPEKETLFHEALREVEKPQRTILAWHGSSVGNWHSIIREGLNYKVVANGRAFGDGVYFSRSFEYSLGYSGGHFPQPPGVALGSRSNGYGPESLIWPQSSLKITQAISLNELVNAPEKFKHSSGCYVVDILHWIQCRYLFVKPKDNGIPVLDATQTLGKRRDPWETFKQDPQYTITGAGNSNVVVPRIAIPSAQVHHQHHSPSFGPDTTRSEDTDDEEVEDIDFLACEDKIRNQDTGSESGIDDGFPPTPTYQEPQTDFRPGSLDFSKLPRLALPSYATKPAQQTIQRELQKLEKIQSVTPSHELGWYIDFDKIENMFQWIVELHSFDPNLPLAKDMKAAGVTSIVLEIRFLRGFPMTPPFVRVIKPRFLPFAMGGGGHVTAGGAMCMELLTNTGWSPANSMESILLQVRLAMCNMDPRPARLEKPQPHYRCDQYSLREAVEAYTRAANTHGWEIPAELKEATKE